jgi:hypothetical protein
MQNATSNSGVKVPSTSFETTTRLTRALLACGIVAGPLYLIAGLAQAFTRPGFDITRHSLSLLSNGALGWIHITNLVVTGLLVIAGAVGMWRSLDAGPGKSWGPVLIGIYGGSLIGAGFFVADPAFGFPPGTPADANPVTWHGLMHFVSGGIGFFSFIAACFVFARRFAGLQQRGWAAYSIIAGTVFFAAFIGIASGGGQSWTILGFWIGLVFVWAWLSALSVRLRAELAVI